MMRTARLKELEQMISEKEFIAVDEICKHFGVHVNTARADIKELERKGVAEKRYGGVARVNTTLPTTFVERDRTQRSAKEEIGIKAARYLEEGDVVYIDSGTTTAQMFSKDRVLPRQLTVITNNLSIVNWVMLNAEYSVFVLPGKGDRQLNSVASLETIESLKNYNIGKAFISCRKVASNGALTSASSIDAKIKETAIARSQQVFLMADSGKVGLPELYSFSNISQVNCWICDVETDRVSEVAKISNTKVV
ncbi:MAG: DeoR/GlpR family DNA-binding transcription regulator [Clostridia bacterium]